MIRMKSGLKKTALFITYVVVLNGILIGAQWLEGLINSRLEGILAVVLKFSFRAFVVVFILIGFVVSFYLIWKVPPSDGFEKAIIWFLRVVTVFLAVTILIQIGLLTHDNVPLSAASWDIVRYNLFRDLGWQSAVWYISLRAAQSKVNTVTT